MPNRNFTQFDLKTPLLTSDYIVGYSTENVPNEYRAQLKEIIKLVGQSLTFDEVNKVLQFSSGEFIDLASLADSGFSVLSSELVFNTAIQDVSGNWQTTFDTVCALSAAWSLFTTSSSLSCNHLLANSLFSNFLSANNIVVTNIEVPENGNAVLWNEAYTTVVANSAQWATDLTADTQVRSLTSVWQNTTNIVQANSASWDNAIVDTDVRSLTGNWQNISTVVQTNSALWAVDSTTDTEVRALTSNWQSTYSTVQSLSNSWEDFADILPTVTNYLSTNNVVVHGIEATNLLTINGNISGHNLRTSFNESSATGDYSFATGFSKASGHYSHSQNYNTTASGFYSHAEGLHSEALDDSAHAEGYFSVASGKSSHAEGASTVASGRSSHAEGAMTQAIGGYSHSEGIRTIASGEGSHSGGFNTNFNNPEFLRASGFGAFAHGLVYGSLGTIVASGSGSFAGGYSIGDTNDSSIKLEAAGIGSIALGYDVRALGIGSHAQGYKTLASGNYSHAEGTGTIASGESSHAEGVGSTASGPSSHAEGSATNASGFNSHAEGSGSSASGLNSHAEGHATQAIGGYSHAQGFNTTSSGFASHAQGEYSVASGVVSHAEGALTTASGIASHAEGRSSQAIGGYSHAAGLYSIANHFNSWIWRGTSGFTTSTASTTRAGQFMISAGGGLAFYGGVGIGTDSIANPLTVVGLISTSNNGTSQDWNNTPFVITNFFPLSGGVISGETRINNNLTVFGNITASGTTTFANTLFSTTSALSVVHVGPGTAFHVSNNGDGDIATFLDADTGVEVLHVGGNNGTFPNVGVKTSTPNKDLTVNGELSTNNTIYDNVGNSIQWNRSFNIATTYQTASGSFATNTALGSLSSEFQNYQTSVASSTATLLPTTVYQTASGNFIRQNGNSFGNKILIGSNDNNSLALETNGIERLLITDSGNLSSNSSSTSFGSGSATGINSFAIGSGRAFGQQSYAQGNNTFAQGSASHAAGSFVEAKHDNTWIWKGSNHTNYISSTRAGQFMVSADGGSAFFGSVGIGTDSTAYELTIRGKAAINDQLYFSSVDEGQFFGKVKLSQNNTRITNVGVNWFSTGPLTTQFFDGEVAMTSDGKNQTFVSQFQQIYTSGNYGSTWTSRDNVRAWSGIAMSSDGKTQTATVSSGLIYVSQDYGITWSSRHSVGPWGKVAMSSDGKQQLIAPLSAGSLLHSSNDFGNTWAPILYTMGDNWRDVGVSSDGRYQIACTATRVHVSDNYGARGSWRVINDFASPNVLMKVAISSDGRIQAAIAYGGSVYISRDSGNSWTTSTPTGTNNQWTSIAMSSDGRYIAIGLTGGTIYISGDFGNNWTSRFDSGTWSSLAISAGGKYLLGFNKVISPLAEAKLFISTADDEIAGNVNVIGSVNYNQPYARFTINGGVNLFAMFNSTEYIIPWNTEEEPFQSVIGTSLTNDNMIVRRNGVYHIKVRFSCYDMFDASDYLRIRLRQSNAMITSASGGSLATTLAWRFMGGPLLGNGEAYVEGETILRLSPESTGPVYLAATVMGSGGSGNNNTTFYPYIDNTYGTQPYMEIRKIA